MNLEESSFYDSTIANQRLMCHLEYVDLRLRQYCQQHERNIWFDEEPLSAQEIEQRIEEPHGVPIWLEEREHENTDSIFNKEIYPDEPLGLLMTRFNLKRIELLVILLGLLPYIDRRYLKLFSSIQGSGNDFPGIELALQLFIGSWKERLDLHRSFLPQSPLFQYGLLHYNGEHTAGKNNSWGNTPIIVTPAVWHFLLGQNYQSPELVGYCCWLKNSDSTNLTLDEKKLYSAFDNAFFNVAKPAILSLRGARESQVARVFEAFGYNTLILNIALLPHDDTSAFRLCRQIMHDGLLYRAGLVMYAIEDLKKSRPLLFSYLARQLTGLSIPTVCLMDNHSPITRFSGCVQVVYELEQVSVEQRETMLENWIDNNSNINKQNLSQRFSFFDDDLSHINQEAMFYNKQRTSDAEPSHEDWHKALRYRAQQNFGNLAQRIEPKRTLDDLIISDELRLQLMDISSAIRYQHRVLNKGFQQKVNYGTGISAMFYGPSGTGKTMAAEVLANAMQVDLIKIDLSSVVNKYIGETEKNLSRIFDLAEADAGVLFFDEADALFGKRSQVKDAKDRHANIEVSYLLQRLENFPGLVILATNNRNYVDEAFSRRFTFITRFSFPDAKLRERMWYSIWPKGIKTDSEINFSELAESVEVTGANIRNIALLASWLAGDEGADRVMKKHIDLATKRELAKLGRINF